METIVVPINYVAVFFAALISMVIGSLWYGPLFGNMWMHELKIKKPSKITPAIKREMMKSYGITFVGSLIMACVLAHAIVFAGSYLGIAGVNVGLMSGLWAWLGFVAPTTITSVLWEGKSWRMWAVNNGYYLVTLSAMGALLALWV